MNKRSRGKVLVSTVVFGVATASVLALAAFEENLLYFYSPTQVKTGEAPQAHSFRVGGLVVAVDYGMPDSANDIRLAVDSINSISILL